MTPVGPQAESMRAMDFDPGATVLWAINFTAQTVGTINQSTGAYTSSAALQGGCCISALTIDPVRGTFYVSKGDAFVYELDPVSGVSVLVAQGTPAGTQIQALSMSCTGRLVAAEGDSADENLYDVDLNGMPTLIGSPGYLGATSIEFDNQTGTLYGWFNPASGDTSTHVTLDTANGQASSATQLAGRFRMAIRNTCTAEQLRIFADGYEG
jgi:hypothetical protein